jgi:hypothetical protein
MEDGGEIWALSGKPVTLGGATVATDDTGTALFTLGSSTGLDGTTLTPSADLQAGRYVLTVQLYVDGTALGRTFAAPLLVGQTASAGGSTGSGSTGSGSTGSGSTGPGSTGSGSTGSGSTGSGSGSTGSGTAPAPGTGSRSYPAVGAFRITGISPTVVSTAGGMAVVITGQALPASPVVRIGSTAVATTVSSSATLLAVRVPARVAGVYDVTVLAPDGTSTVLTAALTYVDAVGSPGSGSSGGTGTGTGSGSTGGGTGSGGTGSGGTGSGGTGSGSTGSGSGGTGTGTTSPAVRAGAHGERLVHSDVFAALGWIWTVGCSASCSGVGI